MRLKSTNIWDDVRANTPRQGNESVVSYQGRFAHGHICESYAERSWSTDDCRAAEYSPHRESRRPRRKTENTNQ